jgi:hypothetical protein
MQEKFKNICHQFQILGDYVKSKPYGTGHINDTYVVKYNQAGTGNRYILQRINERVFAEPLKLMENIERVTKHQLFKLHQQGGLNPSRSCLQLLPTIDGKPYFLDKEGKHWRMYLFIENAETFDIIETEEQAFAAASAFANFQKSLVDLPGERLHETIFDFHNTVKRYSDLEKAIGWDTYNRVESCKNEIDFAKKRSNIASVLIDLLKKGTLPERITHNDTKLNNVMIDNDTQDGICVIDLDTVMPGTVLYDFGDLVRSSTSPVAEDEKDASKVFLQLNMFKALVKGYLSEANEFLNKTERDNLVFSGKLIAYEIGLRFLTDYLNGDVYFKTGYDEHNLIRCRTQFKLVESIEENEERMSRIVEKYS